MESERGREEGSYTKDERGGMKRRDKFSKKWKGANRKRGNRGKGEFQRDDNISRHKRTDRQVDRQTKRQKRSIANKSADEKN